MKVRNLMVQILSQHPVRIILPKTIAKVFVAFLSFLADGFSFRSLGGSFDVEEYKVTLVRLTPIEKQK